MHQAAVRRRSKLRTAVRVSGVRTRPGSFITAASTRALTLRWAVSSRSFQPVSSDVHFGLRYLRSDGDLTNVALLRDDDTHWRVKLNYDSEPVSAQTADDVREEVLVALAEPGMAVQDVWQHPEPRRGDD